MSSGLFGFRKHLEPSKNNKDIQCEEIKGHNSDLFNKTHGSSFLSRQVEKNGESNIQVQKNNFNITSKSQASFKIKKSTSPSDKETSPSFANLMKMSNSKKKGGFNSKMMKSPKKVGNIQKYDEDVLSKYNKEYMIKTSNKFPSKNLNEPFRNSSNRD